MNASPQNSRPWLFGMLLIAIFGVMALAYFVLLARPVSEVLPSPTLLEPGLLPPRVLKISQIEGAVEIRHGQAEWRPAQVDTPLETTDAVRTLQGGSAVLSGGAAYDVRLEPGTLVSVDTLTESISRLLLDNGLATARVRKTERHAFEVKSVSGDAVARSHAGVFTLSSNGAGTVAVGAQEGEVELAGGGKWVVVRAGQQSIVQKGSAPTAPTVVPSSLLLKVQWPDGGQLRQRTVLIQGKTEPGAWVEVAGTVAPVDAQGGFLKQVRLKEGTNDIRVRSRTVGGNLQEQSGKVSVDTTPPKVGIDRDLWRE